MKNIILKLVLGTLVCSFHLSCDKEDDQNEEIEIQNISPPDHVGLSNVVLENIPSFLQTGTNIIYKSNLGEELVITIGYITDTKTLIRADFSYTYDQVTINAVDLTNNKLLYTTLARSQFGQDLNVVNNISSVLGDFTSLITVGIDISQNGEITADPITNSCGDVLLNNKEFKNAYQARVNSDSNTGNEQIYYNQEFGVIGFTDQNRKLWVFDRVEE